MKKIGIIMGSDSDLPIIKKATEFWELVKTDTKPTPTLRF